MDELRKLIGKFWVNDYTVTKYIAENVPEDEWIKDDNLYYVCRRYKDNDQNIKKSAIVNALKKLLLTNYSPVNLLNIFNEFITNTNSMYKIFIATIGVELWKKILSPYHCTWITYYSEEVQYNYMKIILKINGTSFYDSISQKPKLPSVLELKNIVCTNRIAARTLIGIRKFKKVHPQIDRFIFREIAIALWAEI